jgi:hypothetical protein
VSAGNRSTMVSTRTHLRGVQGGKAAAGASLGCVLALTERGVRRG